MGRLAGQGIPSLMSQPTQAKGAFNMSAEAIIRLYDRKPDLTLAKLSRLTGWSVSELKTLLME